MNALRLLASLVSLTTVLTASAQNYSMNWFTIDGGGGACSNGNFSLQGTIGQCDAARKTSYIPTLQGESGEANLSALEDDYEDFSLFGGFWPGVLAPIFTPTLSIRHEGLTSVIVSWPVSPAPYILKATTNLDAPRDGWTEVVGETVIVGENNEMTLRATGPLRLFRLEIDRK